jgi:hypothetical protein
MKDSSIVSTGVWDPPPRVGVGGAFGRFRRTAGVGQRWDRDDRRNRSRRGGWARGHKSEASLAPKKEHTRILRGPVQLRITGGESRHRRRHRRHCSRPKRASRRAREDLRLGVRRNKRGPPDVFGGAGFPFTTFRLRDRPDCHDCLLIRTGTCYRGNSYDVTTRYPVQSRIYTRSDRLTLSFRRASAPRT